MSYAITDQAKVTLDNGLSVGARVELEGAGHFSSFGAGYPIRQGALTALALIAIFVTNRRYHAAFAAVAIAAEIYWIASQFDVLE